jgi:hypothetical protein
MVSLCATCASWRRWWWPARRRTCALTSTSRWVDGVAVCAEPSLG